MIGIVSLVCLATALQTPVEPGAISTEPAQAQTQPATPSAPYSQSVELAVNKALEYLAQRQLSTGAWPSGGWGSMTGVSSLCIMAFLSGGHLPGQGPYGETINRGIDYVLSCAKPNGMIIDQTSHGPMYCHGISTLLLCEVSGMVDPARQKRIDEVLPQALRVILAAQAIPKGPGHAGGWRYQMNSTDSDISCAGWQLMSLRAARNAGADIPAEAIERAVAYIAQCANQDGGFKYQPGERSTFARTGTGVLCLEMCGQHLSSLCIAGGDWLLKHPKLEFGDDYFYYGAYYVSQAMFQLGGRYWETFSRQFFPLLLRFQNTDGSWPRGNSSESKAGECYSTAMSVLSLTVTYRQLPIYQR